MVKPKKNKQEYVLNLIIYKRNTKDMETTTCPLIGD